MTAVQHARIHDVLGYQAREAGAVIEFYNDETHIFSVPVEAAATQVRREALINAYLTGRRRQREICRLLGAK